MRRLLEEERRREAAHQRLRGQRRRQEFRWWLAVAGAVAGLTLVAFGVGSARAEEEQSAELLERLRILEARVRTLEDDQEHLRRALLTFEVPEELVFAGERVPLRRWDVRERLEREVLLALQDRGQVLLWLKRAARYFPFIETALREADLPDDLKYVAVIESDLLPRAGSHAQARGIWHFIPATARRYRLRLTPMWDERRDPELATRAALRYLGDLHREFGQWSLALAAYNGGEARLRAAMARQRVQSYFQLALPAETERYVFRAYAAKLILAEPERYGLQVAAEALYRPPEWDRLRVRVRRGTTVLAIAEATGSFFREIREFNPAIAGDRLPAGTYALHLPVGAARAFALHEALGPDAGGRPVRHRVRRGDTLSAIARRYGAPLAKLTEWNPVVRARAIRPGDVLIVRPDRP
ncbi:MAG: transglycosylase SLT domain-containing protein [candidate division NC10 bacterium]|nr:transglycosylase SLT domain-containing protein [candidate division NC10 bacterium]